MEKKQNLPVICAVSVGLALFFIVFPYRYDIYVPALFYGVAIFLNLQSAVVFGFLTHRTMVKKPLFDDFGMYLGVLVLGSIGHFVFKAFFWGCWLCLALSIGWIILLSLQNWKEKSDFQENNT